MKNDRLLDELAERIKRPGKQTERKERIKRVAISLFAEKGYLNTSTAEIAKVAEVAEGTVFKHYGTKDNLLLSIMVPFIKEVFPEMVEELFEQLEGEEVTFEAVLRYFLESRIAFFNKNSEIFQIFLKEIVYKHQLKQELVPYIYKTSSSRMTKIIKHFQEKGELIDQPSEQIFNSIGTFILGFFISRFVLLDKQSIKEEEIDEIVQFIMNGIGK